FSWATRETAPRERIRARFDLLAEIMVAAFHALGVDARVGEVPGEYCPGEHTVNARGVTKLMGVGQRVISGAAHVGGVVVVDGAHRIRGVLAPVYEALDLAWNPATAGALADEAPGLTWGDARAAIEAQFARRFDLEVGALSAAVLTLAADVTPRFAVR
ncbi:MAG: lipoate--protein ligase family protein, partial [Actinomycetota bacterium]